MQVHERYQREGLRDRSHGVLGQECGQADGLFAQLVPYRQLGIRGKIPLVEK